MVEQAIAIATMCHVRPRPSRIASDRLERALRARIEREFQTVDQTIDIAGQSVRFTRVADPDAVLDAVCAQETAAQAGVKPKRPLRMPYWAAVWESGLALCRALAERDTRDPMAGKATLDLGCGMGMAGMALAALGARVTLVDIDTPCLPFARLNTLPWADRCHVRRCDWQADDLGERYDLIVGSDVLYEVDQWPFVEAFLRKHLKPGGVVLIGEPGRPKAEVFPDWIRARGWSLTTGKFREGLREINVMELVPGPASDPREDKNTNRHESSQIDSE